jgi:hypothetical protein
MPMTPNQADSLIKKVHLTWEDTDADLNITYRPNLLSRSEFRKLQQIAEDGGEADNDDGLAPSLVRAMIGWDLLRDDGTPYPIDLDSLALLGYPVQMDIVRGMVQGPNARSGRRSGQPSAETRMLPPIDSGTSSSPATGEERSMSAY